MNSQNPNYRNYNDNNMNSTQISEDDKFSLSLLNIVLLNNIISITSDFVSYYSTINAIKSINNRYNKSNENIHNADELVLLSLYIGLIGRLLATQVGFTKFQRVYERAKSGDKSIDMKPLVKINTANVLSIAAILLGISASEDILKAGTINFSS